MNRKKAIRQFFNKSNQLTVQSAAHRACLTELFQWLIKTDEAKNDITTKVLDLKGNTTASIISKQDGIVAGIEEVSFLIKKYTKLSVKTYVNDGNKVKIRNVIMQLSGKAGEILSLERTFLNILGRMSGVATNTKHITNLIKNIPNAPLIAATRKAPWTVIDKKAVAVGGGSTHRLNLADEILIKDNHLHAVKKQYGFKTQEQAIQKAIDLTSNNKRSFEIEVETESQAQTAVGVFSNRYTLDARRSTAILLLDNWKPQDVKRFVEKIKKTLIYDRVLFEASGDIDETNIQTWAQTGVDAISLGALTHSAKNFNLSMSFE